MKSLARRMFRAGVFVAAFGLCIVAGDMKEAFTSGSFVSQAHAVIGRPLTPLSYAGVARRTPRRAVAGGAARGVAVAAPAVVPPARVVVAPAPACVQAVDAYGRIYWRCP